MQIPYFSIIMAVQNREDMIAKTLTSIIEQTYENWECIVINDHSTDNTHEVIEKILDNRIVLIDAPKGITGISQVRHFGNQQAKGEYIVVADSDDINYGDRLQVTYDYLQEHPKTDVFYGGMDVLDAETNKIKTRWFQPFNAELLKLIDFIPHPTSVYRIKSYALVEGYDKDFVIAEDYDLWLQFLDAGMTFGYSEQSIIQYLRHSGGISKQKQEQAQKYESSIRKKHGLPIEVDKKKLLQLAGTALRTHLQKKWAVS